jgi:hypothetical protein
MVYASTDFGKSFTYVNQLGLAKESRVIIIRTATKAGKFWISTNWGVWHVYVDFFWSTLVNVDLITDLSCYRSANYGKTVSGLSGGITQA